MLIHLFIVMWCVVCVYGAIRVDPTTGIGPAISSASTGDVIELDPGYYTGPQNCDLLFTSDVDDLSLVGVAGSQNTIVDCGSFNSRCLTVLNSRISLSGISFRNGAAKAAASSSAVYLSEHVSKKLHQNSVYGSRPLPRKSFTVPTLVLKGVVKVFVTSKGKMVSKFQITQHYPNGNHNNKQRNTAVNAQELPILRSATASSSNNVTSLSTGGCILIYNSSFASLKDVQVTGGKAINGSGLSIIDSPIVRISRVQINNNGIEINSGVARYGGGCYISNCNDLKISNSSFSNNILISNGTQYMYGGGLFVFNSAISMVGPISSNNNTMINRGTGWNYGGGLIIDSCNSASLIGPITSSQNTMTSGGLVFGGGLEFYNSSYARILGTINMSNNVLVSLKNNVHGGGISFYYSHHAELTGPIVLSGNLLSTPGGTNMYAAGLEFYNSVGATVRGPLTISNNAIIGAGKGRAMGSAVYFLGSTGSSLSGPCVIANNSIHSTFAGIPMTAPYNPPPQTDKTIHCNPSATITQTSGSINDGSMGNYSPNIQCSWLIQLGTAAEQSLSIIQINITRLALHLSDFLYLYSGSTSQSTLIGQYTGSIASYSCVAGACPSLSRPIETKFGALFVVFISDESVQLDGFELTWSIEATNVKQEFEATYPLLPDASGYPSLSGAGGFLVLGSSLVLDGIVFKNNSVSNSFAAEGGALLISSSTLNISNCEFDSNQATGVIAAGGAFQASLRSQVSCTNCTFKSNTATSSGDRCFYSVLAQINICGSAYGGSITLASASMLGISKSTFQNDSTVCVSRELECEVHGGSIAAVHAGTVLNIQSSRCSSRSFCDNFALYNGVTLLSGGCWDGSGGAIHGDSATISISNSLLEDNRVDGFGSGGAIFSTGFSNVMLVDTTIQHNYARQGGALGLTNHCTMTATACMFSENNATSVGGALYAKDTSVISIFNSTFQNNQATRASVMLAFNDDSTAKYQAKWMNLTVPPGYASLMIAQTNFGFDTNVWNCNWPGTVFSSTVTDQFYFLSCDPCSAGMYAVDPASTLTINRTCQPCPFGAICNGSSPTSNGLIALGGYWGTSDRMGVVTMYPCPYGYCCPIQETCPYNYCDGNRIGRLCGKCDEGQGLRFFTEACGNNDDCHDLGWVMVLILIGSVAIAAVLVFLSSKIQSSGMISVILYFYQVLPLVKNTPWKHTLPSLIIGLQSVFTMTPSSGQSGRAGICISLSMTVSQRLGKKMILQGIVMAMLIFLGLVHFVLNRYLKVRWTRTSVIKSSQFLAAAVRLATITYITLVLIPLQMVQCVWIETKYVWWYDATVECFESWQMGGFVAIVLLLPIPAFIIILLVKRWSCEHEMTEEWKIITRRALSSGFRHGRRWWLGVSLYRRLLLVIIYTSIIERNWKGIATVVICVIFIIMSILAKPYEVRRVQITEVLTLITLTILAATSLPQLSEIQFGTASFAYEEELEYIQLLLAIWPIMGYGIMQLFILYQCKTSHKKLVEREIDRTSVEEEDEWGWRQSDQFQYC